MSDYIFGRLPFRALVAAALFAVSMALLFLFERRRRTGKLNFWLAGLSVWLVGLSFGVFSGGGWGLARLFERLFQLAGSALIVYAAYDANRRMKRHLFAPDGVA